MPRVNNVYELPPGTYGVSGTPVLSNRYNTFVDDIAADLNEPRPVTAGGTGANTAIGGHDGLVTKGADIASAATLNLNNATGYFVDVTGNTGISAVTLGAGKQRMVRFTGTPLITVGASLIGNNGGQNITVEAGDMAIFEGYASNVVRFWLTRASGRPISNIVAASIAPATNDGSALGTLALGFSDLFLAPGGFVAWNNGSGASQFSMGASAGVLSVTGTRIVFDGEISPSNNNGGALGSATVSWADLFLASGGVINWNNSDVTITHSADTLAFAGAVSGYVFQDGPIRPVANGFISLGDTGLGFSNLYLASAAAILFNNGDVTITHSANTLTFAGATTGYHFADGSVNSGSFSGTGASVGIRLVGHTGTTNVQMSQNTTAIASHVQFYNPNAQVGSINTSASSTSFNTTSDECLKDFIGVYDPQAALAVIRSDPTREFTWKVDGAWAVGWGAQTSYAVSPDLASPGVGNPGDEDYQPWGVDQGKRTPYLWAVVPWLADRLDELAARVTAIEGN